MAMRRRSRYRMSPGRSAAIWVCTTLGGGGAAEGAAGAAGFCMSVPHSQSGFQGSHGVRCKGQSELRVLGDRDHIPRRKARVIERIVGIETEVRVQTVAEAEGPGKGRRQAELGRPGDGVASSVAPLARVGGSYGLGVQVLSRGSVVDGLAAYVVRANSPREAGSTGGREVDGSERTAGAQRELAQD